jgi:hypothetical protein
LPAANFTSWSATVTVSKTEANQFYYPDVIDSTTTTVGALKLNAGIYLTTVHDDLV